MSSLGPEIRAALAATRLADAAPSAIRQRGRKRLMSALAAGTVSTSVVVAKGASLVSSGTTISAGTIAGSWLSLSGTLVSSSLIGLSLGLIAISPTSEGIESPSPARAPHQIQSEAAVLRDKAEARRAELTVPRELVANRARAPVASTAVSVPEKRQRDVLARRTSSPGAVPQPNQIAVRQEQKAANQPPAAPGSVKASIARELEVIAEVRRALINGHAGMALLALDRHTNEFPHGALAEEAAASRVVAFCALGRVEEGRHWLATFQSRYPDSPQLKRLRRACPEHVNSQTEAWRTIP
jgi:hypothetical protein